MGDEWLDSKRMDSLPPDVRKKFVEFMHHMYQREADAMVNFLQDSRLDLSKTAESITEDFQELRQEEEMTREMAEKEQKEKKDKRSQKMFRNIASPTDSVYAEAMDITMNKMNGAEEEKKMQEQSEQMMDDITGFENKMKMEREKQEAKMLEIKEKLKRKKADKEDFAMQLIEAVSAVDEQRKQDKDRQEQQFKERLEKKKAGRE